LKFVLRFAGAGGKLGASKARNQMNKNLTTKISKDGKVTFWSVYEQQWKTVYASLIMDRDLATLTESERNRIAKAAKTEVH